VPSAKATGTVVSTQPGSGTSLPAGSTVTLDVSRAKAWREVITHTLSANGSTPPFKINARKWRITYTLSELDCAWEGIGCPAPMLEIDSPIEYEQVDLAEGTHTTYGPGTRGRYRLTVDTLGEEATFELRVVVEEYS
jgi:hypothetical protein